MDLLTVVLAAATVSAQPAERGRCGRLL